MEPGVHRTAAEAMAETDPKTVQDLTAVVSAGGSSGARCPSGRALEELVASPRPWSPVLTPWAQRSGPFCLDLIRYRF